MQKTNFFEKVARHNLERFHSEVLSWLFEEFPQATKQFICSIHTDLEFGLIENIKVDAEKEQTDILIEFFYKSNKKRIYIENKIKASEHFINGNSQTAHYYLRAEDKESATFVYLKPSKINLPEFFTELKINKLDSEIICNYFNPVQLNSWTLTENNPWITMSYSDIYKSIEHIISKTDKSINQQIALEYLTYIKKFQSHFNPFDLSGSGPNSFSQFESFKFLQACINYNLFTVDANHGFKSYSMANSANGSSPLVAFYFEIDLPSRLDFFKSNTSSKLNVGIQIQGTVVKFYISAAHESYQNTSIKNQELKMEYQKFCKIILEEITKHNTTEFKEGKNYNKNTSKTFFSRSFDLKVIEIVNPFDTIKVAALLTQYVNQIKFEELQYLIRKFSLNIVKK